MYNIYMKSGHKARASGELFSAVCDFSSALESRPFDQLALLYLATTQKDLGLVQDAEESYRRLVISHPLYADGWRMYGMFLKKHRQYDKAVLFLRRSLEIQEDIATRNSITICLYQSNKTQEAIQEGQKNLELKDNKSCLEFSIKHSNSGIVLRQNEGSLNKRSKNIISFSLWGKNRTYTEGAIVNSIIAKHIYVGWTARFYCDDSVEHSVVKELLHHGAEVEIIQDKDLIEFKPLWRFLVSDDPEVLRFVCRDADSRLNCQELNAVYEWIGSGKKFHAMRDHIYHMELILAGMWGGIAGFLPSISSLLKNMPGYKNSKFGDQLFLAEVVWPMIRSELMIHDSYYSTGGSIEFPSAYRLPRPIHVGGGVKL